MVTGAKLRITRRMPPFCHESKSQKIPTANPVCGFMVIKNNPMGGGRANPRMGSHSMFALRMVCTTGGERRNNAIVNGVAPRRYAVKANTMMPISITIALPTSTGNNASGRNGRSPHGAAKNGASGDTSTSYGFFPCIKATAAGRYVRRQSIPKPAGTSFMITKVSPARWTI